MKKLVKILCLVLAMVIMVACTGCGRSKGSSSETDVEIYAWKSGFGEDYLLKCVEKFNSVQDKYHVTVEMEEMALTIMQSLDLGQRNNYDLYFTMLNTDRFNSDFLDITSLLDEKTYNEEKTIREKFNPQILDGLYESDGSLKTLTYNGGFYGIVYNTDMIPEESVPRTTDQLNLLVTSLKDDLYDQYGQNVKPWILFNGGDVGDNGYWNHMLFTFEAQYDGCDYYNNNMLMLKDADGNTPSKEVMTAKDGRYKALKVLEQLLTDKTVHMLSSTSDFTTVQTLFLEGDAAMMVNGTWLLNETKGSKADKMRMMKMPVISAITEKLEDTSMSDDTLAAIIDEVDAGATSSDKCSLNDFNRIKEARNTMFNNACEHYAFIPKYSPAIEGAKEFMKFFYSDEGLNIYMRETGVPPTTYFTDESKADKSVLTTWGLQQFDYMYSMNCITDRKSKSSLLRNSNLNQVAGLSYAQDLINNSKDKKSADQLWDKMVARINESWDTWARNI